MLRLQIFPPFDIRVSCVIRRPNSSNAANAQFIISDWCRACDLCIYSYGRRILYFVWISCIFHLSSFSPKRWSAIQFACMAFVISSIVFFFHIHKMCDIDECFVPNNGGSNPFIIVILRMLHRNLCCPLFFFSFFFWFVLFCSVLFLIYCSERHRVGYENSIRSLDGHSIFGYSISLFRCWCQSFWWISPEIYRTK